MKTMVGFVLSLFSAIVIGCGGEDASSGAGALAVRITGEDAAKTGFPVEEEGETIAFADGWTIQFSKVLVSFGGLDLRSADGAVAIESKGWWVADLHAGDASLPVFEALEARRWDRFGYEIAAPDASAVALGSVAQADVQAMIDGKFNYWMEGTATRAGDTYTFAWGLSNPTRNTNCTNGLDGTDGVVIRSNTTTEAEITIHLDHLFWDTLGTEEASLRFDAFAAAAGADKEISLEDLATQALSDLKGLDGMPLVDAEGKPIVYNPGSVPLASQDLLSFMLASSASMGHLNGEGLCTVGPL
ncbi:hypothetical protein KEG38_33370 [Polyangium jinanense]|uniref:hypothetical protein n=1 Tax=Polyangium jinanense TaxID=2829994 RepID=UPI0023405DC6|nr:hypothetical protein [Polyangium jinanense]MDC3958794.1 hypothetical protein [Polyangium jinanense]